MWCRDVCDVAAVYGLSCAVCLLSFFCVGRGARQGAQGRGGIQWDARRRPGRADAVLYRHQAGIGQRPYWRSLAGLGSVPSQLALVLLVEVRPAEKFSYWHRYM